MLTSLVIGFLPRAESSKVYFPGSSFVSVLRYVLAGSFSPLREMTAPSTGFARFTFSL